MGAQQMSHKQFEVVGGTLSTSKLMHLVLYEFAHGRT